MRKCTLHVVQHLAPGGIESLALEFKRLQNEDEETHIVSLEGAREEMLAAWPRLVEHRAHLHFMNKQPGLDFGLILKLVDLLSVVKPTAVQTHHIGPLIYGGLVARLKGVARLIHTEHDAWHLTSPRRRTVQSIALALLKPIIVADANWVAKSLLEKIPFANSHVIHNGVDTRKFVVGEKYLARNHFNLPAGIRLVGCAARLVEEKAIDVLVQAMTGLPEDVHLLIAGGGPCRPALQAQADAAGLSARIHFLGHVENMTQFYQSLDVFCLPSRHEGMPLSPLEAQACGVPVVVSRVGGTAEVVCPITGRLVGAGDSVALADNLLQVMGQERLVSPREFVVKKREIRNMLQDYRNLQFAAEKG